MATSAKSLHTADALPLLEPPGIFPRSPQRSTGSRSENSPPVNSTPIRPCASSRRTSPPRRALSSRTARASTPPRALSSPSTSGSRLRVRNPATATLSFTATRTPRKTPLALDDTSPFSISPSRGFSTKHPASSRATRPLIATTARTFVPTRFRVDATDDASDEREHARDMHDDERAMVRRARETTRDARRVGSAGLRGKARENRQFTLHSSPEPKTGDETEDFSKYSEGVERARFGARSGATSLANPESSLLSNARVIDEMSMTKRYCRFPSSKI